MIRFILFFAYSIISTCTVFSADPYSVVWTEAGGDYNASVPLGNGEVGVNAWVDADGNLHFFLSRTDAWDEFGRLIKVGEIEVRFSESPSNSEGNTNSVSDFVQTLSTRGGNLEVTYKKGAIARKIRLWVDSERPVAVTQFESNVPESAVVSARIWRKTARTQNLSECSDVPYKKDVVLSPDTELKAGECAENQIGWIHVNGDATAAYDEAERAQGMEDFGRPNPLAKRISGFLVSADGAQRTVKDGETQIQLSKKKTQTIEIAVLTIWPTTQDAWVAEARKILTDAQKISVAERFETTKSWWNAFQQRSWIVVSDASNDENSDAFVVSRAYALQRYVNACGGRGNFAIKYNGSIFTVPKENPNEIQEGKISPQDVLYADYRRWGPGYWWQNTRLPYYSMNASGDFDLQQPLFRQYAEILPLCKYRVQKYFGHEGAYFPECIYFWGDVFPETYGTTPWNQRGGDPLQSNRYHKWEWVGGLELAFMALNYYEYTQDEAFLKETAIPLADAVTRFFEGHYKTDAETGKLMMYPSQSAETWWDCTNPMPEIAGLRAVLGKLLSLDAPLVDPAMREDWTKLLAKIPELPVWTDPQGVTRLAPAERFEQKHNIENSELYCVFPFRLVSFEKSEKYVQFAKNALEKRWDRGSRGWRQDDLFMTYLGLADDAKKNLTDRARATASTQRFPAFWGPNYDWTPDQCHGGVLLATLQSMILQTDGDKIFLLPALPNGWNVDFKLHAPHETTITGTYRDGKFVELKVEPESRRKDVVLH